MSFKNILGNCKLLTREASFIISDGFRANKKWTKKSHKIVPESPSLFSPGRDLNKYSNGERQKGNKSLLLKTESFCPKDSGFLLPPFRILPQGCKGILLFFFVKY